LKDATLRWFTGLGGNNIGRWAEMKETFQKSYLDYCKEKYHKEKILRMTQKEDESIEDYVECFQYNLQWSKQSSKLGDETLQIIFLRGIKDYCMDILNLMGVGDVSQLSYGDICDFCKR
jgi:hypothetical protein